MNKCTAMGLVTHVPLVDTFLSSASGALLELHRQGLLASLPQDVSF